MTDSSALRIASRSGSIVARAYQRLYVVARGNPGGVPAGRRGQSPDAPGRAGDEGKASTVIEPPGVKTRRGPTNSGGRAP